MTAFSTYKCPLCGVADCPHCGVSVHDLTPEGDHARELRLAELLASFGITDNQLGDRLRAARAILLEKPSLPDTEVSLLTGVSRRTVRGYRAELYAPDVNRPRERVQVPAPDATPEVDLPPRVIGSLAPQLFRQIWNAFEGIEVFSRLSAADQADVVSNAAIDIEERAGVLA